MKSLWPALRGNLIRNLRSADDWEAELTSAALLAQEDRRPGSESEASALGLFIRLFRWLRGKSARRGDGRRQPPHMPTVHPVTLANSLGLYEAGKIYARSGANPATTERPVAVQAAIMHVTALANESLSDRALALEELLRHFERLALPEPQPLLLGVYADAENAVEHVMTPSEAILNGLSMEVHLAETELRNFKDQNHLDREPRDPPSLAWTVGFALLLLTIESAVNGPLFASSSEYGLQGGAAIACGFAALNLGVSMLAGAALGRLCLHVKMHIQMIGWIGSVAFFALAATAHACFATLRYITSADAKESVDLAVAAAQVLKGANLSAAFGDLTTWFLMAIGVLFSAVSFAKGIVSFGDPYPGYSSVARRVRHKMEERQLAVDLLVQHVEAIYDGAARALSRLVEHYAERCADLKFEAGAVRVEQAKHQAALQVYQAALTHGVSQFCDGATQIQGARAPIPPCLRLPMKISLQVEPKTIDEAKAVTVAEHKLGQMRTYAQHLRKQIEDHRRLRLNQLRSAHEDIFEEPTRATFKEAKKAEPGLHDRFRFGFDPLMGQVGPDATGSQTT